MKKILSAQHSIESRISYCHLVFFAAALPLDRLYSELALISLLLHQLFHARLFRRGQCNRQAFMWLSLVYLLTVVGTLYTDHRGEAFYEWERQLALLLFPLMLSVFKEELPAFRKGILLGMAYSCVLTIVYLYISAFISIYKLHLPFLAIYNQAFINHNFSAPIDMHATYFSMYIALSVAAILYILVEGVSFRLVVLHTVALVILGAGLLQLSSRAVLFAVAVIVNLAAWSKGRKSGRWHYLLYTVMGTALLVLIIVRIEGLRNRLVLQLKDDLTENVLRNNTLEPRAERWKYAWRLVKDRPLFGHGSGSEIALLKEAYFKGGLFNSYLNELNAHNQYLSIAIKTGLVGLLLLLTSLFVFFRRAVRSDDMVFLSFLILVCTVFVSENVLDANKGIFFFAFFLSLFYFTSHGSVKPVTRK